MKKLLALTGVSVLALALILGMAAPALAAPNGPSLVNDWEDGLLRGEVISIGDQEFVIQSGEEELTIAVDEDTRYYLSVPGASVRQRLQLEQSDREQLMTRAENGQGQGLQNRLQAATAVCEQTRLQERLAQGTRASLLGLCCLKGFCPFGEQAEFADIAVGDSVVVLAEDNLAQVVLITKPTAYATVSGTVTDIDSSFIAIDSDDGP
jgi:hypothetical protein